MSYCDLHLHSTHSDGSLTPRELVQMALQKKLSAIAVTDHDTVSGVAEAKAAGAELQLTVLSGVEISVEYGSKTVHVLGYCFEGGEQGLREKLEILVRGRDERNAKIVGRLNELGIGITLEDVEAEARGNVVGRPHFANVMVRRGFVADFQEAFDRFLAKGAPAYFDRLRFLPAHAIAMIQEAGGIAVLAHPKFVPLREGETLDEVVRTLVDAGLKGIEAYYSLHDDRETREYLELAKRYGLLVTGGTDFHGAVKSEILIGSGLGALQVPAECASALLRAKDSPAE